ncbi:MAG: tetratricopeptide repeat protein [Steroidobacteraceae bacterium]|jgi:tetratricopeptide (TPR) repeat protein|nr:tetratricopeptide repeat protein [Steroidobacteraceae bacterium]
MHPRHLIPAAVAATLLVAGGALAPTPVLAVTDAERYDVYKAFRAEFDAARFTDALPIAKRLVELTEQQYGAEDRQLVNPLTNLGTVQYRLGDYAAAESSYLRAVRLIEGKLSGADRMLMRPLTGLGETYLATKQHAEAATALKRAVDLSRNLDGLFNADQLDILDPLIESYVALDRLQEAEKESQYAFRVAESSFGRNDLRMLEPLDRLARWNEFVGRYTTARGLHARALMIAENAGGRGTPQSVAALRGLARSYYLEFIYGPEETEAPLDPFQQNAAMPQLTQMGQENRLNPDGERALRLALEALSKTDPVDRRARGETLVELGDWYLIGGAVAKANQAYRDGWKELVEAGNDAVSMLQAPRRLAYRPPSASIARARPNDPADYEERYVETRFKVMPDGKVADVQTVATDAPQSIEKSTTYAVRKARYAPRLENGEPVVTEGVTLRERVLVKAQQQPDPPPAEPR